MTSSLLTADRERENAKGEHIDQARSEVKESKKDKKPKTKRPGKKSEQFRKLL